MIDQHFSANSSLIIRHDQWQRRSHDVHSRREYEKSLDSSRINLLKLNCPVIIVHRNGVKISHWVENSNKSSLRIILRQQVSNWSHMGKREIHKHLTDGWCFPPQSPLQNQFDVTREQFYYVRSQQWESPWNKQQSLCDTHLIKMIANC